MKTKNCLLLIALISSIFYHSTSFGQGKEKKPHQPNSRKVEELRDQFYKEKLALSPEEESKFWPLFHEHQRTLQKLRKNIKEKKEKSHSTTNEIELKSNIRELTELKTQMIQEEANFHTNAIPLIGVQKTAQLVQLDEQFKKEMMKKIKEKRKEKKGEHHEPKK
jgi:hypothetical protein